MRSRTKEAPARGTPLLVRNDRAICGAHARSEGKEEIVKNGQRGRSGESVRATKVEGNGEGSQQEGGRTDDGHAPVTPPYTVLPMIS